MVHVFIIVTAMAFLLGLFVFISKIWLVIHLPFYLIMVTHTHYLKFVSSVSIFLVNVVGYSIFL